MNFIPKDLSVIMITLWAMQHLITKWFAVATAKVLSSECLALARVDEELERVQREMVKKKLLEYELCRPLCRSLWNEWESSVIFFIKIVINSFSWNACDNDT